MAKTRRTLPLTFQFAITLSNDDAARLAKRSKAGTFLFSLSEQEIIVAAGMLPAEFAHRLSPALTALALRDRTTAEGLANDMRTRGGFTSARILSQAVAP